MSGQVYSFIRECTKCSNQQEVTIRSERPEAEVKNERYQLLLLAGDQLTNICPKCGVTGIGLFRVKAGSIKLAVESPQEELVSVV